MPAEVIETHRRQARSLSAEARGLLEEGYEVAFDFGHDPDPDRVMRVLRMSIGKKTKATLTVRHAELSEYIANGAIGAGLGLGLGLYAVTKLLAAGVPMDPKTGAIIVGGGAVIGLAAGLLATKIEISIYKYRGITKAKLVPV